MASPPPFLRLQCVNAYAYPPWYLRTPQTNPRGWGEGLALPSYHKIYLTTLRRSPHIVLNPWLKLDMFQSRFQ